MLFQLNLVLQFISFDLSSKNLLFAEDIRNGRECGKKLGMGVSFKFILHCWNFWLFVHRLWNCSKSFSAFRVKLFFNLDDVITHLKAQSYTLVPKNP